MPQLVANAVVAILRGISSPKCVGTIQGVSYRCRLKDAAKAKKSEERAKFVCLSTKPSHVLFGAFCGNAR